QSAAHEGRNVAREEGLQTILLDLPAHDVERLRPCVLTRRAEARTAAAARHDGAGGAVAEQGRRDDIALGEIVLAKTQGAELDDEEEDAAVGRRARQHGGARKAEDAAGAAEAEDRQALH